jgi:hypothetical protein
MFFGRALDAGYYHAVLVAGSLLQGLAVFMTSASTQYWQLFLGSRHLQGAGRWAALLPDHLLGGGRISREIAWSPWRALPREVRQAA